MFSLSLFNRRFSYFLFFLTYLCFSSSCGDDIAVVDLKDSLDVLPIESGKNVEITYSDSAQIKLKIYGGQMDRFIGKKQCTEMPKGVKINFFNKEMRIISELTAKYAIRYDSEKKMEARRDVVVKNDKGETLNTEELIWDETKKIIYTKAAVKVTTPKEIIIGEGLEASEDFSKYVIRNITGTINIEDNE
jgi:LPS export ABC transporter protein LptC